VSPHAGARGAEKEASIRGEETGICPFPSSSRSHSLQIDSNIAILNMEATTLVVYLTKLSHHFQLFHLLSAELQTVIKI
jgi:hypothetical protein